MAFVEYSPDSLISAWQNDSASVDRIQTIAAENSITLDEAYHAFAHYVFPEIFNLPKAYERASGTVKHPSWVDFLAKYLDNDMESADVTQWWSD